MAPALIELVGDGNEAAAHDVMLFLRVALHTFPDLSPSIYQVHILITHTHTPSIPHLHTHIKREGVDEGSSYK